MRHAMDLAVAVALACGCATQAGGADAGQALLCGGVAGFVCPQGQVCLYDPGCADGGADCSGTCAHAAREVPPCRIGGCSSELCSDQPLASPCVWRAEFACYGTATCEPQAGGACGWTMTPELAACLAGAASGDR